MTPQPYSLLLNLVLVPVSVALVLIPIWCLFRFSKIGWWPTLLFLFNYRPDPTIRLTLFWAFVIYTFVVAPTVIFGLNDVPNTSLGLICVFLLLPFIAIPKINNAAWQKDDPLVRKKALEYRNRRREREQLPLITDADLEKTLRRSLIWPEYIFDAYRMTKGTQYAAPTSFDEDTEDDADEPAA